MKVLFRSPVRVKGQVKVPPMRILTKFNPQDIKALQSVVTDNQEKAFLRSRIIRNVNGALSANSREEFWLTMVMCLLSTQQRSGPTSPISRFLFEQPFRLSLKACWLQSNVEEFARRELEAYGGIRFSPKIADQMKTNLAFLEQGGWDSLEQFAKDLIQQRKSSPVPDHYLLEREAARHIQKHYNGFGPKQSRNFWQSLGLTRYEFVLDSRILKWLRSNDFPMPLSSMALGEEEYYCFVSDILREWCVQSAILPCVFDAAVFSSFDNEDWPEEAPVW